MRLGKTRWARSARSKGKSFAYVSSKAKARRKKKWEIGLDEMRLPKVKEGRESLNKVMSNKFSAENLKSHLSSTITAAVAAKVVEKLPEGVSINPKQLLEKAREHGGFKKLIPTEGDVDMLEKSPVFDEETKIGLDMGSLFKKAIVLTQGMKQDSQMKAAKKLYKAQTWPCFNSQSSKYYGDYPAWKLIQSSVGANRQGVWYPMDRNVVGGAWTTVDGLKYNGFQQPLLLDLQMYSEIRDNLLGTDIISWFDEEENISADLFYAVNSVTDVVTYSNAQQYLPVELKIYVCKCKSRSKYAPVGDWFLPGGQAQLGYQVMNHNYVYPQSATGKTNPAESGSSPAMYDESSVHLGATPFYSPTFRQKWEVVDLIKQVIRPTDKFELTFHREFRHAHSLRDWEQRYTSMGAKGQYCVGDYALITTFKGLPCSMKYHGTLTATDLDYKEVDASPAKILMTNRSSISVSAPELFTSSNIPARGNIGDNYISGEGRVLDTTLSTHNYSDSDWRISVMSNLTEQEGGSR